MVRLYRTFSSYIVTGETRCAGCLHTSSGWFKHIEPPRTFSNNIITEIARCGEFCCMSSGWFDCFLYRLLYRLLSHEVVRLYRTFSIYIVIGETRCAGYLCTSLGWFKHIESPRTFLNHIITEIARCGEFWHRSSGWFDCTEFSLSTLLQGKQGVQVSYTLVRGGSSTSNLLKPSQTTSSQR